ncbi:MAG: hypothetical protein QXJ23_10590, partial [Thermofilum sp.]|uniref:hypothetical protein n=1 Tax=Thermofilum sp. TaxID=1961369 RepID=UPI00317F8ED4
MLTIRDEIFKILGYVPKSSCQSTTFEPTTIKDRIFLMLGYIPESQCIPITPAPPPSLLPRPTPTPITPTPPHIPIIPPTPPHIPIIPPTVMSLNILASPSNAGTVYPISISNITSLTSATITATPNSG